MLNAEIDSHLDPASKRYGRLLNWQNPSDPFWHYGIGLSDSCVFDTGRGMRPFEKDDARLVIGIDAIAFTPDVVIKHLKHATSFFGSWEYNLLGWNCEHLGRLIATGQPRCYQSQPIWWLCNLTSEGDHKSARQLFDRHLRNIDPDLLSQSLAGWKWQEKSEP